MWQQNKKIFKPRRGKRVFKQCRYKENWREMLGSSKIKNKTLVLFEEFSFL
jgi:hypothetical protein